MPPSAPAVPKLTVSEDTPGTVERSAHVDAVLGGLSSSENVYWPGVRWVTWTPSSVIGKQEADDVAVQHLLLRGGAPGKGKSQDRERTDDEPHHPSRYRTRRTVSRTIRRRNIRHAA